MAEPVESNFNSIKVRLEQSAISERDWTQRFQFHKGTIRTLAQGYQTLGASIFQFHKGTIRTC